MRKQSFRGNVFVANLPQGFADGDLAQIFDAFGLVIGALLARDSKTGAAKTHGLVDIAPQKAAAGADTRKCVAGGGPTVRAKALEVELPVKFPSPL